MFHITIYPGTFDPLTRGHLDIVERAVKIFDQVIVAVAVGSHKFVYLPLEDRLMLASKVFEGMKNVKVISFQSLLMDFVHEQKACSILRGIRAASDYDYEFQLAGMNRVLDSQIETIFLPASDRYAFISSTMVRDIIALGGDVSPFVPSIVAEFVSTRK